MSSDKKLSKGKLESKFVFVDTQSFVKTGLNFEHHVLQSFSKLCKEQKLVHLMTSVVKREIESKIELQIDEALRSLSQFQKKAKILRNLDDSKIMPLFGDIDNQKMKTEAIQVFERFLNESNTQLLSCESVNVEDILDLYFNRQAPFSDKKKNEFPDAISLHTLLEELNEVVYIVSEDSDLKAFCDTCELFIYVETLDRLLDIYNEYENFITELVRDIAFSREEEILSRIADKIKEAEILDRHWSTPNIDSMEIDEIYDFDPTVVEVNQEDCFMTSDVTVAIIWKVKNEDTSYNRFYRFKSIDGQETDERYSYYRISKVFNIEFGYSYVLRDGKLQNIDETEFHINGIRYGIEIDSQDFWLYR